MSNSSIAEKYIKTANNIVNGLYIFKTRPWEDAGSAFKSAANLCACDQLYEKAATLYDRAAQCYIKSDDIYEMAQCYEKSGKNYILCYNASRNEKYLQLIETTYKKATGYYVENGYTHNAGAVQIKLAEFYKTINNYDDALLSYYTAIKYYHVADWTNTRMKCYDQIIEIYDSQKNYEKAIDTCQHLIDHYCKSNDAHAKYQQVKYITSQIFYSLAFNDIILAKRLLTQYNSESVYFMKSNESKFLSELIESLENWDIQQFSDIKTNYSYMFQGNRNQILELLELQLRDNDTFDLL